MKRLKDKFDLDMKMDRQKAGRLLIIAGVAVLMLFTLSFMRKDDVKETEGTKVDIEVPEAERKTIPVSKMEAYGVSREESRTQAYYSECEDIYTSTRAVMPEKITAEDLVGTGSGAPRKKEETDYVNPYRETPEQREARHRRHQEETFRMAQELTDATEAETETVEEEPSDTLPLEEAPVPQRVVIRPDRISSLDNDNPSIGGGISSLDGPDVMAPEEDMQPFKCMFAKNSKIKNGQRVSVILLEDLLVSGVRLPKHTHIMATCTLNGRLEMNFANIEIGGRILPLGYEAYDIDGSRGIYCPDVGMSGKQARAQGRSMIGSRLSGRMGGLARDIVNTGVSIIQSKDGENTVTVPAGYTFYIIKKKDNR